MQNPRVVVDLVKLKENLDFLSSRIKKNNNISVTAITKSFSAHPEIISVYEKCEGIDYLGDSRIENFIKNLETTKEKVLVRIPMITEIPEVVKYTDVSFNTEIKVIQKLNEEAKKQNKTHKILLMVDLGDLREGIFEEEELYSVVEQVVQLNNIKLVGLGVNLTCYGAVIPTEAILNRLVYYKEKIEARFKVNLTMISGGNSSSIYMLDPDNPENLPKEITNLRIGEAFVLGRETAYGKDYKEMHQDIFTLKTEIVEYKTKPSYPIGEVGVDAFGNKPTFVDKGLMKRGIVGIGQQDVDKMTIHPLDSRLEIVGASSDHLIIDFTKAENDYQVGDEVSFGLDYGSLLNCFTSEYVKKEFI
ncbi:MULTISPECIES: ornithine racemase Orr [Vagococcus]|uniref:Ornithine racemase n=1 Tax=Vagococcus fluvialis bH819 TaxID=1255619 RepID=A0A1X6WQQ7_9ENTE|nr:MULTISPECIES: ornithine racemase Orr [Vagococcus]SLM86607.1 Ornithine racemase [Vagococcus fluvialis bH819]HCM90815.1 alanine/ornithine racemase family PLP-dependent enzyme [Vagococcus sp.]